MVVLLLSLTTLPSLGQGLENIVVEKYYIADVMDASDSLSQGLKNGSVTYRIWVDMEEGYKLLSIYGAPGNELVISTSTTFFNDTLNGKIKAPDIDHLKLGKNPLLIDSYIAFSGANRRHLAVYKEDDTDGSILERSGKYQGGLVERGMLMAADPEAGKAIRDVDGLMGGGVPALITFGHDFEELGNTLEASEIRLDNAAWAVASGLQGPYPEKNYILIAQITTDGELSFELNLQLRSPDEETEYYVARNPEGREYTHPALIFPQPDQSTIK